MSAERRQTKIPDSSSSRSKRSALHWIRLNRLLFGGVLSLLVAMLAAILLAGVGTVLRQEVYDRASQDYQLAINSVANQKVRRVLQWVRWHELQLKEWARREELRDILQQIEMAASISDPDLFEKLVREGNSFDELDAFFSKLTLHVGFLDESIHAAVISAAEERRHELEYSIWNRSFQRLAHGSTIPTDSWGGGNDSNDFDVGDRSQKLVLDLNHDWKAGAGEGSGEEGSGEGVQTLVEHADLLTTMFRSQSVQIDLTPTSPYFSRTRGHRSVHPDAAANSPTAVVFAVPVFFDDADPEPALALLIRSDSLSVELEQILGELALKESNCYLATDQGIIATPVQERTLVLAHPAVQPPKEEPDGTVDKLDSIHESGGTAIPQHALRKTLLHSRDPGGELIRNRQRSTPSEQWPWTVSAQGIVNHENGHLFTGYRDYRGKKVVGAWRWIDRVNAGLVLEIPYDQAYVYLNYINRSFAVIISVPLLTAASLLIFSLVRYVRKKPSLENHTLGAYRLGPQIGEGGLGVVYEGTHAMLDRQAAIKVIKPGEVSSETIRHFESEVRLAAKLQHPNAVTIYDFSIAKDGTLYCAMELVDGFTLARVMEIEPDLPVPRIIHVLLEVGAALLAAHRIGLVHRDVKPQNIMLAKTPICDRVKVVDFGLAKSVSECEIVTRRRRDVLLGTPGFLAPERMDKPEIADQRVDVFSFGALGLSLLASQIPPLGIQKQTFVELIRNPHTRAMLQSKDMDVLVESLVKCVATDPQKRPATLDSIVSQLREWNEREPWTQEMATTWWSTCPSRSVQRERSIP